jgi:uncharacterized membrane protein
LAPWEINPQWSLLSTEDRAKNNGDAKMARKLALLAAGAFALLVAASAFDTAEARKGGGGGWGGGRGHHGGGHVRAFSGHAFRGGHAFRSHRFVRRGVIVGVPLAYGAYYYGNSCSWLRHRALVTGSPYWWSRYQDCLYGYDYY